MIIKCDYCHSEYEHALFYCPICYNCNINFKVNIMDKFYMSIAINAAKLSYSIRNKVGAVLVKDNNILSFGWNGTPTGFNNCCEIDNVTKPEVIHAEANVISKIAKSTISSEGSTLYLTLSPCYECAKLIIQSGIKEVIYLEEYRIIGAIQFLKDANIKIRKL